MKDRWETGPKFHEYLKLNMKMVRVEYLIILVLSIIGMGRAGYLLLLSALTKLYSRTLYHQQACLYQSVPVSSFETVAVKTVVGAAGVWLSSLPFVTANLLALLTLAALAFLVCGIALFGVAVGNRVRGNREKRPNAGTAVLVIAGLLLVIYGTYKILEKIHFGSPLLGDMAGLLCCVLGAGGMFWLNVRALERWYSV